MLSRLTIAQKVTLSTIILVLPVVYLLHGIYNAKGQFIAAAENERAGAVPVLTATKAIHNAVNGTPLNDALSQMKKEQGDVAPYFDVGAEYKAAESKIAKYTPGGKADPALVASLQALITAITDKSGMILDPDSDSFYLMDSFCIQIPGLLGTLYDINQILIAYAQAGSISPADLRTLDIKSGHYNLGIQNLENDVAKVMQNARSPFLHKDAALKMIADLKQVNVLIESVHQNKPVDLAAAQGLTKSLGDSLLDVSGKYEQNFVDFLDDRISAFRNDGLKQASIALGLFVLSLVGIYIAISRSVILPLRGLSSTLAAKVGNNLESFHSAGNNLNHVTAGITKSSDQTKQLATQVASASHEVAAGVQTVAASIEEFSVTNSSIFNRTEQSNTIMMNTETSIKEISVQVDELNNLAQAISEVVSVISAIAAQTNLLALNATIESARAGEAGKGFAVVAGEVKTLASQTQDATERITNQIEAVQKAVGTTKEKMDSVVQLVSRVSQETDVIRDNIEQQALASRELSRSVTEASQGSDSVSKNIQFVSENADSTNELIATLTASSNMIKNESDKLAQSLSSFTEDLRRMTG